MEGPLIGLFCLAIPPTVLAISVYIFFYHHASSETKPKPLAVIFAPSARPPTILEEDEDSDSPVVESSPQYPEDWHHSKKIYELERRAIFSKQWLFVTHRSRFAKPGDYHAFQMASYPFFVILGKDHVIRAFHNVCRHRAYTITKKKSGSSTVLGCRYHGWSYDTRGRLVKAPAFEDVENFDKSKNSLFELHVHTTSQGFVFVNLSSEAQVLSPNVAGIDLLARGWRISERSAPLTQLEFDADLNWKQAGKSDASTLLKDLYEVAGAENHAVDYFERTGFATVPLLKNGWKNFFASRVPLVWPGVQNPGDAHAALDSHCLSSLHVSHGGRLWYTLSAHPSSAGQTSFRCEVYLNWPGDNAQADAAIHRIQHEVQAHVTFAEKAARRARRRNTLLQASILDDLKHHLKAERKAGKELWPASRESGVSNRYSQADMLCKQLGSCLKPKAPDLDVFGRMGPRSELDW